MELNPFPLGQGDPDEAPDAPDVSRVERRLAMLEELAEIGMTLARSLAAQAAQAVTASEESRRDPGPAFAQISRAVRLTLAMEATLEAEIFAIRNGEPSQTQPKSAAQTSAESSAAPAWTPYKRTYLPRPAPGEPDTRGHDQTSSDSACPHRNRIRDAVWSVVDTVYTDPTDGHYALDRLHERLIEGEVYDRVLFRPWRDTVKAICDDLDLKPDWSGWSDETGFPPAKRNTISTSWDYWHKQAIWRRKQYIKLHGSEPAPKPPPEPPPDRRPL